MKFQLFALVLLVAGAYAMPPTSDVVVVDSPNQPAPRIIVEGQIRRVIAEISQAITDAGLDPYVIENEVYGFSSEVVAVEADAFIRDLRFSGLSNIRIHSLNYNIVMNRLRFDISLPRLSFTLGDSGIQGSILDNTFGGQFKGSLFIDSIRISGEVRVNVSVISGISLRSISLNFTVGNIQSDLTLKVQERDLSETLNNILNERIPKALQNNRDNINTFLENIVKELFDRFA